MNAAERAFAIQQLRKGDLGDEFLNGMFGEYGAGEKEIFILEKVNDACPEDFEKVMEHLLGEYGAENVREAIRRKCPEAENPHPINRARNRRNAAINSMSQSALRKLAIQALDHVDELQDDTLEYLDHLCEMAIFDAKLKEHIESSLSHLSMRTEDFRKSVRHLMR